MSGSSDIGLIGLAVMGQNLVLNMNDHGYKVAVFNRTTSKVDHFIDNQAKGRQIVGTHSIEEMCNLLKAPRRIMMMIKAGKVVDETIEQSSRTSRKATLSSTVATPFTRTLTV